MSFMKPRIYKGDYYLLETSQGTEFIPGDIVSIDMAVGATVDLTDLAPTLATPILLQVRDYIEGSCIESIERCEGFYGRYSADGYLDATDYSWGSTEAEVLDDLQNMYGEDSDHAEPEDL